MYVLPARRKMPSTHADRCRTDFQSKQPSEPDTRQSLNSKPDRESREEVGLHLAKLLVDEEFVARCTGPEVKPEKEVI